MTPPDPDPLLFHIDEPGGLGVVYNDTITFKVKFPGVLLINLLVGLPHLLGNGLPLPLKGVVEVLRKIIKGGVPLYNLPLDIDTKLLNEGDNPV